MSANARNQKAVKQLQQVAAEIRQMDRRVDDLRPLGPGIGAMLSRDVRRQFTTKGAYMTSPWKPLSPHTIRDKVAKGYSAPNPLVRTGRMKMSFIRRPMSGERYTKKVLWYGSRIKRAYWQQYGTRRNGRRHIPPRVILKLTPLRKREIKNLIARYVATGRKR